MTIILQGLTSALLVTQGYTVGVLDPFARLQAVAKPGATALGVAGAAGPPPLVPTARPPFAALEPGAGGGS